MITKNGIQRMIFFKKILTYLQHPDLKNKKKKCNNKKKRKKKRCNNEKKRKKRSIITKKKKKSKLDKNHKM